MLLNEARDEMYIFDYNLKKKIHKFIFYLNTHF